MRYIKEYYTIKLHDTDAAGILFFANQLRIVHDVYERFMTKIDFPFRRRFEQRDFYLPIVHTEADFFQPLAVGDTVEINLKVEAVGNSSFMLAYTLIGLDGIVVGTARTVHVTVDPATWKKIPLPEAFRKALAESAAD